MAFRISDDCDDWFKYLIDEGIFKTQFDRYYLCLMAGIASARAAPVGSSKEFVRNFVDDYKSVQLSLLGLLIYAEAKRFGVTVADRDAARGFLNGYLDPNDSSRLSSKGFSRLNEYAAGGFIIIRENFSQKPYQFLPFIERYTQLIRKDMPVTYAEFVKV